MICRKYFRARASRLIHPNKIIRDFNNEEKIKLNIDNYNNSNK